MFAHGDHRHVVVGPFKEFLYCGLYRLNVVEPLTGAEWNFLPPTVRVYFDWTCTLIHHYCLLLQVKKTQIDRSKAEDWASGKSDAQILALYDSGARRLPCVRLECIKFDSTLYEDIVRALESRDEPPAVRLAATVWEEARSCIESSGSDSGETSTQPSGKRKRT